jgi:hypothetical protein
MSLCWYSVMYCIIYVCPHVVCDLQISYISREPEILDIVIFRAPPALQVQFSAFPICLVYTYFLVIFMSELQC